MRSLLFAARRRPDGRWGLKARGGLADEPAAMRTVPRTSDGLLSFASVHAPVWGADPGAIGMTAAQVAAVAAALAAARQARGRAAAARQLAASLTALARSEEAALRRELAASITRIRLAAAAAADPASVFARAEIPPTLAGAAEGAGATREDGAGRVPRSPTNASVSVNARGEATVTWTTGAGGARGLRLGRQRAGRADVQYLVSRRGPWTGENGGDGGGAAEFLGLTSTPRFVDPAPLPGRSEYLIRAVRGDARSPRAAAALLELPVGGSAETRRARAPRPRPRPGSPAPSSLTPPGLEPGSTEPSSDPSRLAA